MHRRTVLAMVGGLAAGSGGCLSLSQRGGSDAPTASPTVCSYASIDAVELTASTAGDRLVVRGTVTARPAPALRGFIITTEGGEQHRDEVSMPLAETGGFRETFSYPHHAIVDYAFWLHGCPDRTPTPDPE